LGIADHELQFRQWLGEHTGLLVKVARSFAEGPADQDDLFQEILLQVWLSLPNFRDDSKPTTWLYRVALNTALAWKRSEKKRGRFNFDIRYVAVVIGGGGKRSHRRSAGAAIRAAAAEACLWLVSGWFLVPRNADARHLGKQRGVSLNRIKKELAATVQEDKYE
jgi:RNA polymerase sigma-70 factor (ECF subfamily)